MKIAAAGRPKRGEIESGDQYLIVPGPDYTLIALADGLGHGPNAAAAARAACDFLRAKNGGSLVSLIRGCDRAIAHTRGVALTLARIDHSTHTLAYAGIGNVEMQALSEKPVRPPNAPGVVGARVRRVNETEHRLARGDLLVLFTDGISSRFRLEDYSKLDSVEKMAESLLADHGKDHDDATCIFIRYQ